MPQGQLSRSFCSSSWRLIRCHGYLDGKWSNVLLGALWHEMCRPHDGQAFLLSKHVQATEEEETSQAWEFTGLMNASTSKKPFQTVRMELGIHSVCASAQFLDFLEMTGLQKVLTEAVTGNPDINNEKAEVKAHAAHANTRTNKYGNLGVANQMMWKALGCHDIP